VLALVSALLLALAPGETASPIGQKVIASLARAADGESTSSFSTETPTVYLRWEAPTLKEGEKIRCIWIAEDVGKSAPKNYIVGETSVTAEGTPSSGTLTLSKPKAGWPEGKYRAEIFLETELVATLSFTIEKLRGD
jgi:hypothetical protein